MAGPKNAKDVYVDVTLNSETPGDFTIEPFPPGSLPKGPKGELVFENKGHPGFFVHFRLQDRTGLGYFFPRPNDRKEAVWSQRVEDACPESAVWDVFDPRNISGDRLTLIVHNPNVAPVLGQFGYTLRVTKNNGQDYLPLDPGGDNRNGPVTRADLQYILVGLLSGAAGGAAATLLSAAATATSALTGAAIGAVVGVIAALILGGLKRLSSASSS
jgi:hypothetical protein